MKSEIVLEQVYKHPPERVWRVLTDTDALSRWLMKNSFQPRVGHKFHFQAKPMPGWDGTVECEVLELDEPRKLVYTWYGRGMKTTVTWTLEPVEGGTRLRLEHKGFTGIMGAIGARAMRSGWTKIMGQRLSAELENHA